MVVVVAGGVWGGGCVCVCGGGGWGGGKGGRIHVARINAIFGGPTNKINPTLN